MGAWIEIRKMLRGAIEDKHEVAPYMGAWIEIRSEAIIAAISLSLPTWERGLKLLSSARTGARTGSLPTWERGLKSRCQHNLS